MKAAPEGDTAPTAKGAAPAKQVLISMLVPPALAIAPPAQAPVPY